ncbi:hypothetical protein F5888DRAFT_371381 [Russula emetica]|nr:hypothetical protein F5888DRAFT_371381 [Russula emetica]
MGVQSYPVATCRGHGVSRYSKAGGNHSGQSNTSTESPKHPLARTRTATKPIVSRTGWPSKVPKPTTRPGKGAGRTSRSEASLAIPEQATSTSPPKEEVGGSQHMSRSSKSNKLDMQTSEQENSGMKCNTPTLSYPVDTNPDLPPKAVHLTVTCRCTSTFVASLVSHPTAPISLWNFKYETSHDVTTIVRLPQSNN